MAVSFKIGVGDLRLEFLTDALVFGLSPDAAGTVSARALQALLHLSHNLAVVVEPHLSHMYTPPVY